MRAFDGNGFKHTTRDVGPCCLQEFGDVFRTFDGNLHGGCGEFAAAVVRVEYEDWNSTGCPKHPASLCRLSAGT